jgi:hypothetical protein
MAREKNPVFRRTIIPWYDSDRACWIVVGFTTAAAVFSVGGIFVALEKPSFHSYIWLPLLLLLMSAGVAVTTLIRLFRRYLERLTQ